MIGISLSTLKQEFKQGAAEQIDTNYINYTSYLVYIGQKLANINSSGKGPGDKIGNNYKPAEKLRVFDC